MCMSVVYQSYILARRLLSSEGLERSFPNPNRYPNLATLNPVARLGLVGGRLERA